MPEDGTARFAGYDVLAKHDTLSWNDKTREVIDARLGLDIPSAMLGERRAATLAYLVQRICPDPANRPPTTTAALVARKIVENEGDGFRHHKLPPVKEAWERGLDAIEAEAQAVFRKQFTQLEPDSADDLLRAVSKGETRAVQWTGLPPKLFWTYRLIPDCVSAHWAQPQAWSAMGFGGPASPRGYVRLKANRRDPWEAEEEGSHHTGLPRHRAN
ncbi:MAG: gluconate 2-dehydrogenase [Novosphingobium sp.]|nr:gluconate 2-dehydrogenase [Novosphingobium sp.]|tara:strand:- start:343 stop:987 length:645 start_codon:yes stop_codon:yes gene_type:complete